MREFKLHLRQLVSFTILAFALYAASSCIDVNTDIGGDYASSKQQMVVGSLNFDALGSSDKPIFTSRHYKSDSINVANQGSLLMGVQKDKYFGTRYCGFFSQISPVYELDSDGFGVDPILDSVILFISVNDYAGDTTAVIKYDVYEIIDDSFLGDFNPEDEDDLEDYHLEYSVADALELFQTGGSTGVLGDKLYSFYFPDQNNVYSGREVYLKSSYVRLFDQTDAGYDFMQRLMLQTDNGATYEMYDYDEEWEGFYDYHKGLFIVPSADQPELSLDGSEYDGATYKITTSSSGLGFYARTRHSSDSEFIKDTIGMNYNFYDSYFGVGVNSINVAYHDSVITDDQIVTDEKDASTIPTTPLILVEGVGGIVNELRVEQELFKQFEAIIEAGDPNNPDDVGDYSDIFFNSAILSLYVTDATKDADGNYQLYTADFYGDVDLDEVLSRLGLYYSYTTFLDDDDEYMMMVTATDYNYSAEYSYSTVSNFDGYINRSRGCYVMNIPLHMQDLWTLYQEALEDYGVSEFTQEQWYSFEWNKLYIAPEAANLFTPHYVVVQGVDPDSNAAPLRFEIIYTLLK